MALPHAQPLDVIDVRPLGAGLRDAVTTSLLKTQALQLMHLVLPAGQRLPEHSVPGAITVQCLEGDTVAHLQAERWPARGARRERSPRPEGDVGFDFAGHRPAAHPMTGRIS